MTIYDPMHARSFAALTARIVYIRPNTSLFSINTVRCCNTVARHKNLDGSCQSLCKICMRRDLSTQCRDPSESRKKSNRLGFVHCMWRRVLGSISMLSKEQLHVCVCVCDRTYALSLRCDFFYNALKSDTQTNVVKQDRRVLP